MSDIHPEKQYLDLIKDIIEEGYYRPSPHRPLPGQEPNPGTYSLIGRKMVFDLSQGYFPLMTTRKVYLRGIINELLWFLSGSTNNRDLQARGSKIWDPWDTRDTNQAEGWSMGQLGPIYGKQWRHWGRTMVKPDGHLANPRPLIIRLLWPILPSDTKAILVRSAGIDQISWLVRSIVETPNSKRLFVSAYDHLDARDCFVTTCHGQLFFQVWGDTLHLEMVQRSGDVPVGIPFNIASYSLLLLMLAQVTGLKAGTFHHEIADAHLYENQVDAMKQLLDREPLPYPSIRINPVIRNIFAFSAEDFELLGYEPHPHIHVPVAT